MLQAIIASSQMYCLPIRQKQLAAFSNRMSDGNLNMQLQQAATNRLDNRVGELMLRKKLSEGKQILNKRNPAIGISPLQAGMETVKISE
jgi:hypothetical protein